MYIKKALAGLLCFFLLISPVFAAEPEMETIQADALQFLQKADGLGDWTIFVLLRSNPQISEQAAAWYRALEKKVIEKEGQLSATTYTEYARTVLVVASMGGDPSNVAGYDLCRPLLDVSAVSRQGVTGIAYALLALQAVGMETTAKQECDQYRALLLERSLADGGWTLFGENADPDVTAIVLCALAADAGRPETATAIEKGLTVLSKLQNEDGGFSSYGEENAESCAQVLIALTEVGCSIEDTRFVKNQSTVLDALQTYCTESGGFSHVRGGETSQMATVQAVCAMEALHRKNTGQPTLYDCSDAPTFELPPQKEGGLATVIFWFVFFLLFFLLLLGVRRKKIWIPTWKRF